MEDSLILRTDILYEGNRVRTSQALMEETFRILLAQLKAKNKRSFTISVAYQGNGIYCLEIVGVESSGSNGEDILIY